MLYYATVFVLCIRHGDGNCCKLFLIYIRFGIQISQVLLNCLQNDQLKESFLSFEWYLLPIELQKEFSLLFIFMQGKQTLTVGGSMQLDVNLFVQVRIEWII